MDPFLDRTRCQWPITLGVLHTITPVPAPHPPPARLCGYFRQALEGDLLDQESLGMVNAYQPSLTSTWMFQKSMSVGVGEKVDENLIVDLLANNFRSMDKVPVCCIPAEKTKPFTCHRVGLDREKPQPSRGGSLSAEAATNPSCGVNSAAIPTTYFCLFLVFYTVEFTEAYTRRCPSLTCVPVA